ncbi:hypothetical protein TTHERM_01137230 (macronuclear) [Tetrahymena thermophila SB210]|uniref:Uncharacterized protein n=1 Tax=Tetrahymena thermophila (strain SB210) TaxID=312017 RepID=Q235R4_TETTS|nr:hypothetical protein TTHERM_01137230 [Tetrahymena thermophila SB210]EAR92292.1 hypothetical protein TTHERM_01137230 [Tetrahymena thermophila SB210]|eukprot:XP_001012537.1 hypothetical protein TTHERM_01137230 [Tetrahymena thermophila SB210]
MVIVLYSHVKNRLQTQLIIDQNNQLNINSQQLIYFSTYKLNQADSFQIWKIASGRQTGITSVLTFKRLKYLEDSINLFMTHKPYDKY